MEKLKHCSRRTFLGHSSMGLTLSALSTSSNAAELLGAVNASSEVTPANTIIMYRKGLSLSELFAESCQQLGMITMAIEDDLVRQWRDGLFEQITENKLGVLGLSNWSDFLMFRGLAREDRLNLVEESRIENLFSWELKV